jgi:porin
MLKQIAPVRLTLLIVALLLGGVQEMHAQLSNPGAASYEGMLDSSRDDSEAWQTANPQIDPSLPAPAPAASQGPARESFPIPLKWLLGGNKPRNTGEPTTAWRQGKYVFEDWDGLRLDLSRKGIEPFVFWTGISSGNPLGGEKQGHVTAVDDFYIGVKLELNRIMGWRGASMTISGVNRDGRGLTNEYIMGQYNVQQSVGGQSLFFYQLTLDQLFDEGKVEAKIGRFGASDDFNVSPIYSYYVNNGIDGDIRNVLFDTQFSAYPFSTWAGMLRFDPNRKFYLMGGVFQTWKNIFNSSLNGVDWTIHPGDGVIAMEQGGWTPTFIKKSDGVSKDLPGHYWLGSTYSPWKGFTQFNSPEKVANSYGFYAHADQMVYRKDHTDTQGLTVWAAAGYYPQQNISIVPLQLNVGLIDQGLFHKRNEDRTIFGLIYGRFSRDYAHSVMAKGNGDPRYELVLEGGHRFQLTKFSYFQPDLQWEVRPAGTGKIPNAIVAGAEVGLTF